MNFLCNCKNGSCFWSNKSWDFLGERFPSFPTITVIFAPRFHCPAVWSFSVTSDRNPESVFLGSNINDNRIIEENIIYEYNNPHIVGTSFYNLGDLVSNVIKRFSKLVVIIKLTLHPCKGSCQFFIDDFPLFLKSKKKKKTENDCRQSHSFI